MIGRKQESEELNRIYNRNKAELVAIYGRRRVGKTYLVDETFEGRITFRHAGLSPADEDSKGLLKLQLEHFYNSNEKINKNNSINNNLISAKNSCHIKTSIKHSIVKKNNCRVENSGNIQDNFIGIIRYICRQQNKYL